MIYKCNKCGYEHHTGVAACLKCEYTYFMKIETATVQQLKEKPICLCGQEHIGISIVKEHWISSICSNLAWILLFISPILLFAAIWMLNGGSFEKAGLTTGRAIKFLFIGIVPFLFFRTLTAFFSFQGEWKCVRCGNTNRVDLKIAKENK